MPVLFMEITDAANGGRQIVGLPHVALIKESADDGRAVIFLTGDHVPTRQIITKESFETIRAALGVTDR